MPRYISKIPWTVDKFLITSSREGGLCSDLSVSVSRTLSLSISSFCSSSSFVTFSRAESEKVDFASGSILHVDSPAKGVLWVNHCRDTTSFDWAIDMFPKPLSCLLSSLERAVIEFF
jgi:hypothetical protein